MTVIHVATPLLLAYRNFKCGRTNHLTKPEEPLLKLGPPPSDKYQTLDLEQTLRHDELICDTTVILRAMNPSVGSGRGKTVLVLKLFASQSEDNAYKSDTPSQS